MMDAEEKEKGSSFETTLHSGSGLPIGTQRCFNGGCLFLQQVYYELGLDRICAMVLTRHGFSYNPNSILSRLVSTRILSPAPTPSSLRDSRLSIEQPDFELHQVCRALSVLAEELHGHTEAQDGSHLL